MEQNYCVMAPNDHITLEDIARVVTFLALDAASSVTGQALLVDTGFLIL